MKRSKHHKVKREMPETSTSHNREQEEHDLAYYIHDRVELMHQVFSVLKYKEIKAMAPACVRNITIDDLQELCTEELLGISSKRLCAILDGAEPPSDTDTSSQSPTEALETISLDSISSDEEILSHDDKSKKKKHKHRRHSKSKSKRPRGEEGGVGGAEAERSAASRAGLTVLELLELQARARAIRAQLQKEQTKPPSGSAGPEGAQSAKSASSEDEVEIKEEPAEVVEISSDDEKPNIEDMETDKQSKSAEVTKTVTKRVNDLVITVPAKKPQKIKLNRTKSIPQDTSTNSTEENTNKSDKQPFITNKEAEKSKENENNKVTSKNNKDISVSSKDCSNVNKETSNMNKVTNKSNKETENSVQINKEVDKKKDSSKIKDKSKKRKVQKPSHASDNDEITLQLSDTEKMDLLEDLDRKTFENVSSDTSSDSDDSGEKGDKVKCVKSKSDIKEAENSLDKNVDGLNVTDEMIETKEVLNEIQSVDNKNEIVDSETNVSQDSNVISLEVDKMQSSDEIIEEKNEINDVLKDRNLSEGELSDRESSGVEAIDIETEIVTISDDETKHKKKKKKKEKKAKKDKKRKKDFRENCDQNFENIDATANLPEKQETEANATENIEISNSTTVKDNSNGISIGKDEQTTTTDLNVTSEVTSLTQNDDSLSDSDREIVEISDEIYELSDSSYDGVDTKNVLSKEPTASEIEALSAKIDEIDRVEVITDKEIAEYESKNDENISWKDRYLDSKKVKRVLNTSNILNALRRKNKQLKKTLEETKIVQNEEPVSTVEETTVMEGSIDQYNTLEGSTKFVDPVKEVPINDTLKKDAKQLLKMYKKLLKYNDMERKSDPNKKKKKKKAKVEKQKNDT
ncbi:uncharacterized protein LOC142985564 [Anticarsia gemmatalis]|uniref:uncharacterized protein LOC142985564 n=1 Tax=Anticarsia gemmatalis TaxID=129554 RepID=UPI003F76E6A5